MRVLAARPSPTRAARPAHCEQLRRLLVPRLTWLVWNGHTLQDRLYLFAGQQDVHQCNCKSDGAKLHRQTDRLHLWVIR